MQIFPLNLSIREMASKGLGDKNEESTPSSWQRGVLNHLRTDDSIGAEQINQKLSSPE